MLDFSLPLALYDFVPVLLTAAAMFFLATLVGRLSPAGRPMAALGGALVVVGGLAKASWKLIAALTGQDVHWLSAALFPLMAPGLALMAVAVWGAASSLRGRPGLSGWALIFGALAAVLGAVLVRSWALDIPRGWFLPLLALASLSNLVMTIHAIRLALSLRQRAAAALFALNLLMVFALPPIAMAAGKTLAIHWIEQTITALGTLCLATAAWRLLRAVSRRDEARQGRSEAGGAPERGSIHGSRAYRPG